jgi:hypothetical protein
MADQMHTFEIEYTDAGDSGCPIFRCRIKAYDREHAEDKFWSGEDCDWEIVSVSRVRP